MFQIPPSPAGEARYSGHDLDPLRSSGRTGHSPLHHSHLEGSG